MTGYTLPKKHFCRMKPRFPDVSHYRCLIAGKERAMGQETQQIQMLICARPVVLNTLSGFCFPSVSRPAVLGEVTVTEPWITPVSQVPILWAGRVQQRKTPLGWHERGSAAASYHACLSLVSWANRRASSPPNSRKVREEFGTRLPFLDWITERNVIQGQIDVVGEVLQGPHKSGQPRLAGKSS